MSSCSVGLFDFKLSCALIPEALMEEKRSQLPIARVKLGTQGLEVSSLGFGCVGLSGLYNAPLSHEAGCSVIIDAFHKGITFFDTSDLYGAKHDNEIMVGKALKQLPRENVQLATKFGVRMQEDGEKAVNGSPEYVRKCCEASLKRLDLDYVDLYYQHRVDTTIPIEDTMGELKMLVEEGKIKYIGLCEASPDTIRRAHAVHPITALQMEYSLWSRDIEEEIIPLCRELGIGIIAYSPLGRGFFGGKAVVESLPTDSILAGHPRFTGDNLEKNKLLYTRVENLAAKHGCTPPQLALSWVLYQGNDVVPIPGTTKLKNLYENIGSLEVKLTEDDIKEISAAVPMDEVAGCRIHESIYSDYAWNFANTPTKDSDTVMGKHAID
ncbi:perakine reductase-like isoform X1 [Telopea speciosissima]|uniref:perakine reductase-like isoform X1 n=1 Tax=Telopea speciosissima TaxID=54955 RepID=UPI001CC4F4D8|nr:perakine reductase-like isoform X1 [Telopea speciosissima]